MLCKIASDLGYPGPEKLYISTRRSRYHHQCGEDSATKMTVKRHWWFVKEDGQEEVFVYVTDPKKSGASGKIGHRLSIGGRSAKQPTSAVEKLDVDAKNRNGLGQVGIKIHFKNHRHTLYRQEFEWHRNDFCRNFRDITVAADFVTKYNELVSSASDHTEEQTDIIPPDVSMDTDSSLSDSESPLSSPSSSQSCSTSSTSGSSTERRSLSPEPINNSNNICTGNGDKQNKNKRPRSGDSIPDLMKKKRKRVPANEVEADNSMQQLVEGRAIPGIFSIHMCNLKLGKQVREVDSYFVTKLVDSMERFTDDSYSPYIVLVDLRKEQFNKNNVNGYEYTILGGQHNFTATKQMSEKYKDKPLFKSRNCKIYCDLSEEAAMWLSNRHNDIQHLVHKISTREKVQLCRDRLSSENTASEEWRKSCKNILQQNGKDIETILNLAKLQPDIASTLDDVFEAYETGTLKGQKLNKKTMMTKPDLPVYLFHNLVLLNDDTISDFLQNIRDGEMTLQEMNREAKEVKKLKTIQESMVKELHMPWQMFSEKLPEYASREYLSRFKELSFSRGIPPEMVNECRKIRGILDAGENVQDSNHTNIFSGQDGTKGCILNTDVVSLTAKEIKACCPEFTGAELTLIDMDEIVSDENIEQVMATLKAINLDCGVPYYNVVVFCQTEEIHSIKTILKQTCTRTEEAFYFVKNNKSSKKTLWKSVYGIVIGYWSEDGQVNSTQLNFGDEPHHNLWMVEEKKHKEDMYKNIISVFSSQKRWVLDITRSNGAVFTTAVNSGRPSICVEMDGAELETVYSQATKLLHWNVGDVPEEDFD